MNTQAKTKPGKNSGKKRPDAEKGVQDGPAASAAEPPEPAKQSARRNTGRCAVKAGGAGGKDALVRQLVSELSNISRLLADGRAGADKKSSNVVLLGRIVQGLQPETWEKLAQENNLDSWLAMPMDQGAADSLKSVTAIMDRLVYQRDHDSLTGLANRRYFDKYLESELQRAKRNNTHLSLAMLDLDNFKTINDTYGHPCGDEVLREIGRFLLAGHRSFELAARVGGDEFSIILPGSNVWNARNMLERICADFSERKLKCENSPDFEINFSAGIAGVGPEIGYQSAERLIKQADQALYEAKRKGKNQVCLMADAEARSPSDCLVLSHEKKFLFSYPEQNQDV